MKKSPESIPTKQPLAATKYVVIAAVGLAVAIGFTFFYVRVIPSLHSSGAEDRVFYVLLIPWALSCSAFLFGAMRGYAGFKQKRLGGTLELGGPAVLFCLVVAGGFKLVPAGAETFEVSVRASAPNAPLITSGEIVLDAGGTLEHHRIGSDGEAVFRGLSSHLKGAAVRVLPEIDGYEQTWTEAHLDGPTINLVLKKAHPETMLTGSVIPAPAPGERMRVVVDGQQGEAEPDGYGRFRLTVAGSPGDTVRLKVFRAGGLVKMDDYVLPGPITIVLKRSPGRAPMQDKR